MVLLAEARIGAELAKAQARGEVERPGGDRKTNVRTSDNDPATLSEIGIPRQRAAEMKKLAGKEPAIRADAKAALAEGRRTSAMIPVASPADRPKTRRREGCR